MVLLHGNEKAQLDILVGNCIFPCRPLLQMQSWEFRLSISQSYDGNARATMLKKTLLQSVQIDFTMDSLDSEANRQSGARNSRPDRVLDTLENGHPSSAPDF